MCKHILYLHCYNSVNLISVTLRLTQVQSEYLTFTLTKVIYRHECSCLHRSAAAIRPLIDQWMIHHGSSATQWKPLDPGIHAEVLCIIKPAWCRPSRATSHEYLRPGGSTHFKLFVAFPGQFLSIFYSVATHIVLCVIPTSLVHQGRGGGVWSTRVFDRWFLSRGIHLNARTGGLPAELCSAARRSMLFISPVVSRLIGVYLLRLPEVRDECHKISLTFITCSSNCSAVASATCGCRPQPLWRVKLLQIRTGYTTVSQSWGGWT